MNGVFQCMDSQSIMKNNYCLYTLPHSARKDLNNLELLATTLWHIDTTMAHYCVTVFHTD